jgi:cyclophilin family peptidyl-prolyl cis-trans isomerase
MKNVTTKLLLPLLLLISCGLAPLAQAQDVVVFQFQIGDDKRDLKPVVIELYPESAPITVENFKKLARKNFYRKQHVHRVIPNYLIQLGDPQSRDLDNRDIGTNGPGYTLPPEIRRDHQIGSVAMARLPDDINPARRSNGSQFYIALDEMSNLDGKYTVFGRVISGLEHVKSISTMAADTNQMPTTPVMVRDVDLMDRAKAPIAPALTTADADPDSAQ